MRPRQIRPACRYGKFGFAVEVVRADETEDREETRRGLTRRGVRRARTCKDGAEVMRRGGASFSGATTLAAGASLA